MTNDAIPVKSQHNWANQPWPHQTLQLPLVAYNSQPRLRLVSIIGPAPPSLHALNQYLRGAAVLNSSAPFPFPPLPLPPTLPVLPVAPPDPDPVAFTLLLPPPPAVAPHIPHPTLGWEAPTVGAGPELVAAEPAPLLPVFLAAQAPCTVGVGAGEGPGPVRDKLGGEPPRVGPVAANLGERSGQSRQRLFAAHPTEPNAVGYESIGRRHDCGRMLVQRLGTSCCSGWWHSMSQGLSSPLAQKNGE